jgi:hypothetical protein
MFVKEIQHGLVLKAAPPCAVMLCSAGPSQSQCQPGGEGCAHTRGVMSQTDRRLRL